MCGDLSLGARRADTSEAMGFVAVRSVESARSGSAGNAALRPWLPALAGRPRVVPLCVLGVLHTARRCFPPITNNVWAESVLSRRSRL